MKVYIKFFINLFFRSLMFVVGVIFCLVFILNYLGELDFFQDIEIDNYFTIFLALLNSPDVIFEMFPFIFLITFQIFFIKLFNNNELVTLKYSGFKNSKIITIIIILSLATGIFITTIFYYFSSNLKNFYLELKSPYSNDGKYLAVITKNGLWIRDKINDKTLVINSSKIDGKFLVGTFITEFDSEYNVTKNIKSEKIDVSNKKWLIYNAKIYKENYYNNENYLELNTNFDYKRINSLYSNLSSLNVFELFELRKNYKKLNYSVTELDLQLLRLTSLPIFLVLMSLFSSLIMLRIKHLSGTTLKIAIGLLFSVIIYYFNNFFYVLGSTEKLNLYLAIFVPIFALTFVNLIMLNKINEK
ncbi:LptF/LptG family permease [Candidatus Pelagibacter sp. HIMB1593]|uniref:LptF/LptG family permease n=1 Tax=Candidatus Pelagibacter sp. HIMB1593 TaxID=3413355 RepID=UPI003F86CECA